MFEFLPKLVKSGIFFGFLILFVIMFPSVVYKTAESERVAITVMLGIDIVDGTIEEGQIELSLMFLTPQSSNNLNKNYAVVTTVGHNVTDCLYKIETKIGKEVGLSHCQVIIVSLDVAQDNLLKYLDSFTRNNDLTTNALIICSQEPKKLIDAQISESSTVSLSLEDLLNYNSENMFTKDVNLERFYMEYFDESSVSFVPIINTKENQDQNSSSQSSSSSSNGGSNSGDNTSSSNSSSSNTKEGDKGSSSDSTSGSNGKANIEIDYNGEVAVFQHGTMVARLESDEAKIFNLLSKNVVKSTIHVENVSTRYIDDADFSVRVKNKTLRSGYSFVQGKPTYTVNMTLLCELQEVNTNQYSIDAISLVNTHITEELQQALKGKILEDYSQAINMAKENNIDMFYLKKYFYRLCTKEWQDYMLNLDANENFMKDVIFILNVNIVDVT